MEIISFFFNLGLFAFLISFLLPLAFIVKDFAALRRVSLFFIAIGSVCWLGFSALVLLAKQNFAVLLYSILPKLEISFLADKLSAFFILIISIVAFCVAIYSYDYVEHIPKSIKRNFLISLMALFILSLIMVVLAKNLLSFLFFWEIMSLSSFFLVMFDFEKEDTGKAGIFYFVMTQMSTIFLLFAFILIYNSTGNLEIRPLKGFPSSLSSLLFLFLFIGFGIKAGIIPFHKWLPYAHPASPSPISALMSGVMIKVAIYGFIRFLLLFNEQRLWWGILILIFGTVSALLGVVYALKEHDLKKLLAFHSIENIGIILMGIGLYSIFNFFGHPQLAVVAIAAALFHSLNHALFKSLLFLTAGSVVNSTHTKNIEEMGGLIKKMPYTAILFLIGSVSISALPPFNGFVSELMIFEVFFQSSLVQSPLVEAILFISLSSLAMTSALAAACFVKAFAAVFLAVPRSEEAADAKEAPISMLVGPGILAIFCALLGIFSFQIFSFIGKNVGYEFQIPNLMWLSLALLLFGFLTVVTIKLFASRQTRVGETWGCGILSQNSKMEYTASGFSEPITNIFKAIYRTKIINEREFNDNQQSNFKSGRAEIRLLKFFDEFMYLPIGRAIRRVSLFLYHLQNKVELDPYILYSFLTVTILVVIAGWAA